MRTLFEIAARREIEARLDALSPDSPRQWGRMTAPAMVAHASDQLRMALGEIPAGEPSGPFSSWPMNRIVIHWLPWPKGKARGPAEAFSTRPSEWQHDKAELLRLIEAVGQRDPSVQWPTSSIFGRLTGEDWGVLCYRHLDHHLKQFGC